MRVLVLFIKYSVMIVLVLGVIGLIAREGFLFWGTQQVRIAESKMELIAGAKFKANYDSQCQEKGKGRSGMRVQSVQLRFTSDTEYQSEVVCDYFSNDPIVVDTYTLPMFVKKAKGQAGFVWDKENTSGVVLEVFHRTTTLLLENGKFRMVQGTQEILGKQPISTCGGFGYSCCPADTQVGQGDVFAQASDCPSECYRSCTARPSVLKFTSDPNPDLKTRTVTLTKGAPITFYFVTDPGVAGQATTQLRFGDGQTQDFPDQDGNYTYQYQCVQPQCEYTAQAVVTDPTGNVSALTTVSSINIVIR